VSFPPRIKYGVNSSGNPDAVSAKAGNYINKMDSRSPIAVEDKFRGKPWIPRIKYGAGSAEVYPCESRDRNDK